MSTVVIGQEPRQLPLKAYAPLIYVKERWNDNWQLAPQLQHIRHDYKVSEAGVSSAEFLSRYGNLKQPFEREITYQDPLDLRDFWVRIDVVDPLDGNSTETQFVGIIYSDVRVMRGDVDTIAGQQPWVAYGPLQILRNIDVFTSYWLDDDEEKEIERMPSKNLRDKRKLLIGNRTDDTGEDGTYLFGGKSIWTNLQLLQYFLNFYVQQFDGPVWTVSGQTDILDQITDNIEFSRVENIAEIFKKLMKREYALDYRINYTNRGFEIFVFSQLSADSNVIGNNVLPSNPNVVVYLQGLEIDTEEVKIVKTRANMYDSVRVIGKNAVMCATLGGPSGGTDYVDLLGAWNTDLEDDYIAGAGQNEDGSDKDASAHDEVRKQNKFRTVYQLFTPPDDWDYRGGDLAPIIGLDGTLQDPQDADLAPVYQNVVRSTLTWIPMKVDFDYSTDPETDRRKTDADPELDAPIAYVFNPGGGKLVDGSKGWVSCHTIGISLSVPHQNLGIILNASPNHLLALNHAFIDGTEDADTTEHPPEIDFDSVTATIAWETDQCVKLGFDIPDAYKINDGSVKVVYLDDAEMWILAPNTIVGQDADGKFLDSGDDYRILRDDTARIALIAAGIIGRYIDERVRAEIQKRGFWPWGKYVGRIFKAVEGAQNEYVGAPITTIEWISGNGSVGKMIVKTGYA